MAWYEIGFWQGDYATEVADVVCDVDGAVIRGTTVARFAAGIHFLAQWDNGDDDESLTPFEVPPTYGLDKGPFYFDGYALVVNPTEGTVALYRFAANDDDGDMLRTCLVCGEYVDYCLGGHHSQVYENDLRNGYAIAGDEYDAAYAALERRTENML